MKLLSLVKAHGSGIGEPERRSAQAVLDKDRPFIIISKRPDDGRWETSCWLPPKVQFYELLGAVEMLKDEVKALYLEDDE